MSITAKHLAQRLAWNNGSTTIRLKRSVGGGIISKWDLERDENISQRVEGFYLNAQSWCWGSNSEGCAEWDYRLESP